jgi:hypothetical protein
MGHVGTHAAAAAAAAVAAVCRAAEWRHRHRLRETNQVVAFVVVVVVVVASDRKIAVRVHERRCAARTSLVGQAAAVGSSLMLREVWVQARVALHVPQEARQPTHGFPKPAASSSTSSASSTSGDTSGPRGRAHKSLEVRPEPGGEALLVVL